MSSDDEVSDDLLSSDVVGILNKWFFAVSNSVMDENCRLIRCVISTRQRGRTSFVVSKFAF